MLDSIKVQAIKESLSLINKANEDFYILCEITLINIVGSGTKPPLPPMLEGA
jgi:hypothetical protein